MRENRTYGSEGGAAQINASFLPLSTCRAGIETPLVEGKRAERRKKWMVAIFAGMLLMGLMLNARSAVRSWRDSRSLWAQTLAHTEKNFVAHGNMGTVLFVDGETEASIEHFKASLMIEPNRSEVWNNLAVAYADLEQWEVAVLAARKALDCLTEDCREKNRELIHEHLREYEEAFLALEKSGAGLY